jgi:glutamyl endopeptidase
MIRRPPTVTLGWTLGVVPGSDLDPYTTPPIRAPRPAGTDASVTSPSPASPERVLGPDERTRVLDIGRQPYPWICALRIYDGDRVLYGTGWLAGERLVVTAGHCVYLHDVQRWATSIEVYVGLQGARAASVARSTSLLATDGWLSTRGDQFDYAGILLDQPLGRHLGYFAVASATEGELRARTVNVTGYPADRDGGTNQYEHAGRIVAVSPSRFHYDADTYAGQSGCPVWTLERDGPTVLGLHTIGDVTDNSALRVNSSVLANLRSWKNR